VKLFRQVGKFVRNGKEIQALIVDDEEFLSRVYFYQMQAGDPSAGSGQSFVDTEEAPFVEVRILLLMAQHLLGPLFVLYSHPFTLEKSSARLL